MTNRSSTLLGMMATLAALALLVAACGADEPDGEAAPPADPATEDPATEPDDDDEDDDEEPPEETAPAGDVSFEGETIRIVAASAPGGGFDTYARLLAQHMGGHLPGNPHVIVENRPGGGHRVGSTYIWGAAPKDGTVIGFFFGGLTLQNVMGDPSIEWDARGFEWIGAPTDEAIVCVIRADAPATTIEEMQDAEILTAANVRGNVTADTPTILAATTGAQIRVITGYEGTGPMVLAVDRNEVHGICTSWEALAQTYGDAIDAGDMMVYAVLSPIPMEDQDPGLPDSAWIGNLIEDPELRDLALAYASTQVTLNKPLALPPGTPPEVVETVREAFMATVNDPAFRESAEAAGRHVAPITGDELQQYVEQVFALPDAQVQRLQEFLELEF